MFIFLLKSIILIWNVFLYYFLFKSKVYIDNKKPTDTYLFCVCNVFYLVPPAADTLNIEKDHTVLNFPCKHEKRKDLIYARTGALKNR